MLMCICAKCIRLAAETWIPIMQACLQSSTLARRLLVPDQSARVRAWGLNAKLRLLSCFSWRTDIENNDDYLNVLQHNLSKVRQISIQFHASRWKNEFSVYVHVYRYTCRPIGHGLRCAWEIGGIRIVQLPCKNITRNTWATNEPNISIQKGFDTDLHNSNSALSVE